MKLLIQTLAPIAALVFSAAAANAGTFGNFNYVDNGTSISITSFTFTPTVDVDIPASIDGKPVTSIGERAFYSHDITGSVTIPSSVTSIGDMAFEGCDITSVTISSGVTSIGDHAFDYCTGLTSVTIPSSVTSLGDYAFAYCYRITSLTISSSVTSIGAYAFASCFGLTSVTIPSSVTSIGERAFYNCDFTSVTIPSSVTSIGRDAFDYCTKLSKATFLGNAPTMWPGGVFWHVAYDFKIYFMDGKTGFTTPTWQGYPSAAIYDRPEISIQQPTAELVDGYAKKSFGSMLVGNKSLPMTFTIKNLGIKPLTGLSVTINGLNAKDFIVTQPLKTSLVGGTNTTFKVRFKPLTKGTKNAAIHIKSNDANENPFDIKLVGLGVK